MSEKRRRTDYGSGGVGSNAGSNADTRQLKYLQVQTEDETGGGWYRQIDEAEIEVLSRAQLERVHVDSQRDAESAARGKIAEMIGRPRDPVSDKAH
jgi:hypothetical protein